MVSYFSFIIFVISLCSTPLHGMHLGFVSSIHPNILTENINPDKNNCDYTLLRSYMEAIQNSKIAAIHKLQSHPIDLDLYYADYPDAKALRDEFKQSPVDLATAQTLCFRHADSYKILADVITRSHKCPLSQRFSTPFHKIAQTDSTECIGCFFDKKGASPFDINKLDIYGQTPLHYAAILNNELMVRELLYHNALIRKSTTYSVLKSFNRLPQDIAQCNHIKKLLNEVFERQSTIHSQ